MALKGITMKEIHTIVGVHITDRLKEAVTVQKLLTEYGNQIKTRLGLHELSSKAGLNGLLILDMIQPASRIQELISKLNAVQGVECKSMTFEHPV